jgi:hypothetical protein
VEELRLLESVTQEPWAAVDQAECLERICLESAPERQARLLELLELKDEELPELLRVLAYPELVKDALSLGLVSEGEAGRLAEEGDDEALLELLRAQVGGEKPRGRLPSWLADMA